MSLPYPKYAGDASRELVSEFRGLNVTDTGGDGGGKTTFSDMINGGTDKYPFAASRLSRGIKQCDENTCALFGGEVLVRIQPPYLVYDEKQIDLGLFEGEKQIVMMGTDILVFPDAVFYDTVSGECGLLDEGVASNSKNFTHYRNEYEFVPEDGVDFSALPCNLKITGETEDVQTSVAFNNDAFNTSLVNKTSTFTLYGNLRTSTETNISYSHAIISKDDGFLFYLSGGDIEYKITSSGNQEIYSVTNAKWTRLRIDKIILPENITLSAIGIPEGQINSLWKGNTHIEISLENGRYCIGNKNVTDVLSFSSKYEYDEDDYGVRRMTCTFSSAGWKTKTFPTLDYVCIRDNRLWGCRYGTQIDGSTVVNRIYVSALGNYKEFEQFKGISTDSWYGDCGEEGAFTGACTFDGHPMFFKENIAYIMYGDYPPFSYSKIDIRGVAKGAAKSLHTVNGVLYWKSRHDIMRYTGSSLDTISAPLGDISDVARAVAGSYRNSYYISLDGSLFVYDTTLGIWSKEDVQEIYDFATVKGETYFLSEGGIVYSIGNGENELMPWSLTSPNIGYRYPNRKYISQLRIRIELGEAASLEKVELSLDGQDFYECNSKTVFTDMRGKRSGTVLIPMSPKRCETFRYRISGVGEYKITGITKVLEESGI